MATIGMFFQDGVQVPDALACGARLESVYSFAFDPSSQRGAEANQSRLAMMAIKGMSFHRQMVVSLGWAWDDWSLYTSSGASGGQTLAKRLRVIPLKNSPSDVFFQHRAARRSCIKTPGLFL